VGGAVTLIGPHLRAAWIAWIQAELSAVFRHDLRNKLGAIRNALHYLRKRSEGQALWSDARVPRMFELVESELKAAGDLITPPAPPARGGSVVSELVDRLVQGSPALLRTRIQVAGEAGGLRASAAPDDLELALACLLDNALEASADGPVVVTLGAGGVVIAVEVRGGDAAGIDAGQLAELRRPFASTRPGHLGMGLNVVARIAGSVSGGLDVSVDGGTWVATLTLPVAFAADATPGPRALIIDDDAAIRLTLGALLEEGGVQVTEADSVQAGASALAAESFDLVVLDWHLPDGTAEDFVARLGQLHRPGVLAVMSGARLEAAPPGVDVVLEKGGDPAELVTRLLTAINVQTEAPGAR
jgi:CheY-like chemotaxis protein